MLWGGVAACHRCTQHSEQYTYHTYDMCIVRRVECTQHSAQYTYNTYDTPPHHCITYNDTVFTEFQPKYNFS